MRSFDQALQQEAVYARYEAVQDRRNAALARSVHCDVCREWVDRSAWERHVETPAHVKAERRYLAERE